MASSRSSKDTPKCVVKKCDNDSARSISAKKAGNILELDLNTKEKKAHLCKDHYKEFRKATKKDRKLDILARK